MDKAKNAASVYVSAASSKVSSLMAPEKVEMRDLETDLGRTRIFWIRRHLLEKKPPLVLIHGWGAGAGCFFRNVHEMAADRSLMLIDLPGFAESDRPEFGSDPESDWIKSLQAVLRDELQHKFWLAGHSFGGFLAARLAMEEGERLEGVILMDPWGFKEMNEEEIQERWNRLTPMQRCFFGTMRKIKSGLNLSGLEFMRAVPKSIGPGMMKWLRKDLKATYGEEFIEYIYEINCAQPASGEKAFDAMGATKGFGYARDPMSPRLIENWKRLPSQVHFIYGGKSWITSDVGLEISDKLKILSDGKISSTVEVIENATHHLMCTHPSEMNSIVNNIIQR